MTAHLCMRRGHWVYLTVLLLVYINSVQALNCYVCNSTLDDNCNAKFEKTEINPVKPQHCNVYNAKYCIKVYGMWGGVVGTHRFCSSRDMGEQCQDIWYADHERMYRSCVFTCSGDACNATERLSTKWYHISAGMILSLACILFTSNLH
ncbi:uncharacterized protein LOC106870646 [Octopus bimaculoides]|uniref:uncharacterized protein LOC106870646 n=1 Tax=Octopus bimaculoides TaxID=37653 RepID=UPI00071CF3B9|nr:uncharacterized protein LOC106870646 [Octopus bimaculoides]|eukprot:XP_014772275.1 PREDICTED: uncharacterized protein LOC106870646 [Octopus bimaculoides]